MIYEYFPSKFIEPFAELQKDAFKVAQAHGFHENDGNPLYVPTALALIASEVSEALEAHRKGDYGAFGPELADIIIRTMDLAESYGINLAKEVFLKHEKNKGRPMKHGNKLY